MTDKPATINLAYFRLLRGRAFGIRGRTALAAISIAPEVEAAADRLTQDLIRVSGLDRSTMPQTVEGSHDALRGVIVESALVLAREARLPVFDDWKPTGVVLPIAEASEQLLALPGARGDAMKLALGWGIKVARTLLEAGDLTDDTLRMIEASRKALLDRLVKQAPAGTNAIHFMRAAHRMGLETHDLPMGIVSYGTGRHARWLLSSVTDRTSQLGCGLAQSKAATRRMLLAAGLPAPFHRSVRTADDAVRVARELGFPVVVKPDDQEQGKGVSAGLMSEDQVREAFALAAGISKQILLEKHHDGQDIRLTVANGEVVKVFAREAGGVFGDGEHTVEALLANEQATPRAQRLRLQHGRFLLDLDAEALSLLTEQGLRPTSIPEAGRFVRLRRKNNVSAGGRQSLVETSEVHPDNLDLAIRAARALRLDIAGIDLITPDVSRSWTENGAVILEVNSKPQIGISLLPEAYEHILRGLVGPVGNIPVHLMLAADDAAPGLEAAVDSMRASRKLHGSASIRGVRVGSESVRGRFGSGFEACTAALGREELESLLCVLSVEDVLESGLPVASLQSCVLHAPPSARSSPRLRQALAMIRPHLERSRARADGDAVSSTRVV